MMGITDSLSKITQEEGNLKMAEYFKETVRQDIDGCYIVQLH